MIWLLVLVFAQEPQVCAPCHNEQIGDLKTHKHSAKGMQCSVCHGASLKHRESTGNVPPDRVAAPEEVATLCGSCHVQEKTDYLVSAHQRALLAHKVKSANCVTCHGPHSLKVWSANEAACSRCHVATPASCKNESVKKSARVSCMNCHASHSLSAK